MLLYHSILNVVTLGERHHCFDPLRLTSVQATAAERHGTRAVLFVSLLGSSLTCLAFGTSTTLPQAMAIRLLQGVFAGAIGVGRGTVALITDPSNEGRAYAILG